MQTIRRALLLLLIPAAAGAQVTSGTSPASVFYETSGSGEPVVLIHAFSVDRRMWVPQITALEGRFQVIRYDLRGHGNSAAPSAPYAPHEARRGCGPTRRSWRCAATIPGAGHMVNLDARDAFNAALLAFLPGQ